MQRGLTQTAAELKHFVTDYKNKTPDSSCGNDIWNETYIYKL
jgi:hypothetical protein